MVANYELESEFFVIDKSRTKYALLEENDTVNCAGLGVGFLKLHPLYPTNVNKFCVIALFMSNDNMIRESCVTKIRTKWILLVAKIIRQGLWAVTLREKNCVYNYMRNNKTLGSFTQVLIPPIDKVEFSPGCVVYSTKMTLPNLNLLFSREELIVWARFYEVSGNTTEW